MPEDNAAGTIEQPAAPGQTRMQQAAASAREQLAAPANTVTEVEEGTPSDTSESEAQPAEDTEKAKGQPQEEAENPDALLTPEQEKQLTGKAAELYKQAQKAFTQKRQAHSAELKAIKAELEGLQQARELYEALSADPNGTVQALAKQLGLVPQQSTAPTGQDTSEELPEGLEFLEPYLKARDERIAAKIRAEIEPVKQFQTVQQERMVEESTEATLKAFTAKYPDWKQYEAAMTALGQKFQPKEVSDPMEYLETLYKVATYGRAEAEQAKKVISQINKSAEKAETVPGGVKTERVEHTVPRNLSSGDRMKAAFAAAKRGETWTA